MSLEKDIVKIALYVACNDGLLSDQEEQQLIESSIKHLPNLNPDSLTSWIEEFFAEEVHFENYCSRVTDHDRRIAVLDIAFEAAAADGLDPRENQALLRIIEHWNISRKEVSNANIRELIAKS